MYVISVSVKSSMQGCSDCGQSTGVRLISTWLPYFNVCQGFVPEIMSLPNRRWTHPGAKLNSRSVNNTAVCESRRLLSCLSFCHFVFCNNAAYVDLALALAILSTALCTTRAAHLPWAATLLSILMRFHLQAPARVAERHLAHRELPAQRRILHMESVLNQRL